MTTFDVNGDGLLDLFLMHTRNDLATDTETDVTPHTGRYIQVLVNRDDGTFGDETDTWVKGQDATLPQRYPDGEPLYNTTHWLAVRDLDRDACADLLMVGTKTPIRKQSPLAYRNTGQGQFQPLPPELFLPDPEDEWFGYGAWPADVNGMEHSTTSCRSRTPGPDEQFDTRDDYTSFDTMLNTTTPKPVRCK